ncbi:MAG: hypothetical protein LV471_11110 [Nitrosomonas sp.]|nr:hypothetical protein [Nitrosomonas sp.]
MGWLHSRPKNQSETKSKTRAELIADAGREALLPSVDEVAYVATYWQELGMVGSGAGGPIILSAQEIIAWQQGKQINLNPWEFSTLRSMSVAYIGAYHDGEKPDCPAPYGRTNDQVNRDKVARDIGKAFRTFIQAEKLSKKA